MRVKDFFEWLINEIIVSEIISSPKGKESQIVSRFASKLYRCLSDRERKLADNMLDRILRAMNKVRNDNNIGKIKGAINIVRKYI